MQKLKSSFNYQTNEQKLEAMNKKMMSKELSKLFKSEPIMYPYAPQIVLENWKKLGPIDFERYLNKSVEFLKFDPESVEFEEYEGVFPTLKFKEIGYFKKGTNIKMGLCRRVFDEG